MMRDSFRHLRGLGYKTFLLSLLLHIMVIKSLIFTFPPQIITNKPSFVFLGPILSKNEFPYVNSKKIKTPDDSQNIAINPPNKPSKFNPRNNNETTKPIFYNNMPKTQRVFIKSTFLDKSDRNTFSKESEIRKGTSIKVNSLEYIPLSLPSQ